MIDTEREAPAQTPPQDTVMPGHPHAQSMGATLPRRRIVLVVVGLMMGMLLASLDQTIVGTAMPRVIAELQGLEHYAWVFTAYMLASTVMVPVYGKLSDIYGRKPFFLGGMAIFLIGSALSGTSQTMAQLIIYRAIQGLGAGAMMPISQAIVGDIFPPAERGKWQGVFSAVFGLTSIIGPTLGGWITDNWGWRWTFYVNMPVGAIALVVAGLTLPSFSRHMQHKVDYLGSAALVAGTVPLLLAFSWAGTQYEWVSPQIIGLLAASVVMLGVFFFIETRAAEPIISPKLFKNDIFTVSVIGTFLVTMGMFGTILYLPLFVQGVLGTSATDSGAVLTPLMLGFIVSSIIGGQIISRTGKYKTLALTGLAVAAVGMFLLSVMGVNTTQWEVVRNMVITGLGIGVMMALPTIVVQNAFPFSMLGQVTAGLTFFRSIGGTIGAAVLGSVMTNSFQSAFRANMPQTLAQVIPPDRLSQLQNPEILLSPDAVQKIHGSFVLMGPQGESLFNQLMNTIRVSLSTSVTEIFLVGAIIMALAFVAWLFIREIPLRKSHHAAESIPEAA